MSHDPQSTDANVASPAFLDDDRKEGEFGSDSIRAVMINRDRMALYRFWRDFGNLPQFMENVRSVEVLETDRTAWTVAGPAGAEFELVTEVTDDQPGERIAWTSLRESDVDNAGWIEFRDNPFGRGTEVRLFISYDPPAGAIGKVVAKVMQREPRIQARRELRRFKQLMETGEVPTNATVRADV